MITFQKGNRHVPVWTIVLTQVICSTYAISSNALTILEWGYDVDIPIVKYFFSIFGEVDGWGIENVIFAVSLGIMYWIVQQQKPDESIWLKSMCMFIAINTVLGKSYYDTGTWNYIFHGRLQFGLACFVIVGYYLIYKNTLLIIKYFFEINKDIFRNTCNNALENWLFVKHSFLGPLITIFVAGLPWIIFFWPGTIQDDSMAHLYQYYGSNTRNASSPVAVTWLMGECMDIGKNLFRSDNMGLFTYTGSQFVGQTFVFAYSLFVMKLMKSPIVFRWLTLIFYAIYPIFPMWGFTLVKDTGYYVCTLLFVLSLIDLFCSEANRHWRHFVLPMLGALGMSLFRYNGVYIVVATLIVAFFLYKEYWRTYLATVGMLLMIVIYIEKIYIPQHNVGAIPIVESVSVPMQLTGRYLREHMDEVTPEEYEVLQEIIAVPLEEAAAYYNPESADDIKTVFRNGLSDENLSTYYEVWFQQFRKHPTTYIQGFLNHTYGYFYPDRKNFVGLLAYTKVLGREVWEDEHMSLSFGIIDTKGRDLLVAYTNFVQRIPVLGMIYSAGLEMYIVIACVLYLLAHKRWHPLTVLVPSMCMLFCIMSPVNAYFRYVLPLIVTLPINISWCYYTVHENKYPKNSNI